MSEVPLHNSHRGEILLRGSPIRSATKITRRGHLLSSHVMSPEWTTLTQLEVLVTSQRVGRLAECRVAFFFFFITLKPRVE